MPKKRAHWILSSGPGESITVNSAPMHTTTAMAVNVHNRQCSATSESVLQMNNGRAADVISIACVVHLLSRSDNELLRW